MRPRIERERVRFLSMNGYGWYRRVWSGRVRRTVRVEVFKAW